MKKFYVTLITVLLIATSSLGFAGSGHYGGGSASPGHEGSTGAPFATPGVFGGVGSDGDDIFSGHEREFEDAAPGAWSNDPEPGKDKPSDNK